MHGTLLLDNLDRVYQKYDYIFQYSTQRPKENIFVPKFFFLLLWMKLYTFTNSSVLIKNLIIVFVKLQAKNTQLRYFCSQVLFFFCFWMTFCKLTDLGMLISNLTYIFWQSSRKYPIKTILVPNLRIFIFVQNFVSKHFSVLM